MKLFKDCELKITVAYSAYSELLDITLNLRNKNYEPYRKLGNHLLYINKNSNYPKKF